MTAIRTERLGDTDKAGAEKSGPEQYAPPDRRPPEKLSDIDQAAANAFEGDELATLVAKVEAVGPDHYGMDFGLPENAFRFERHIKERQRPQT